MVPRDLRAQELPPPLVCTTNPGDAEPANTSGTSTGTNNTNTNDTTTETTPAKKRVRNRHGISPTEVNKEAKPTQVRFTFVLSKDSVIN
jgi:hypothetical protein